MTQIGLGNAKSARIDALDGRVRIALYVGGVPVHTQYLTTDQASSMQLALDHAIEQADVQKGRAAE